MMSMTIKYNRFMKNSYLLFDYKTVPKDQTEYTGGTSLFPVRPSLLLSWSLLDPLKV